MKVLWPTSNHEDLFKQVFFQYLTFYILIKFPFALEISRSSQLENCRIYVHLYIFITILFCYNFVKLDFFFFLFECLHYHVELAVWTLEYKSKVHRLVRKTIQYYYLVKNLRKRLSSTVDF